MGWRATSGRELVKNHHAMGRCWKVVGLKTVIFYDRLKNTIPQRARTLQWDASRGSRKTRNSDRRSVPAQLEMGPKTLWNTIVSASSGGWTSINYFSHRVHQLPCQARVPFLDRQFMEVQHLDDDSLRFHNARPKCYKRKSGKKKNCKILR